MVRLVDQHASIKTQHMLVLVVNSVSTSVAADNHTSIQNTTHAGFDGDEPCWPLLVFLKGWSIMLSKLTRLPSHRYIRHIAVISPVGP